MVLFQSTESIRGSEKDKGWGTTQLFKHARPFGTKSPIESEDFRIASPEDKIGDLSILEKNVPRCIGRMCCVGKEKKIANIFSSNALLPTQFGPPRV